MSIEGEGETTVIESHVGGEWSPTISLASATACVDGNQHISKVRFDGNNLGAWGGVYVAARSRVSVHDCTFVNFRYTAVIFNGKTEMYAPGEPTTYCMGNRFHANTVTNCCFWDRANGYATGALHVGAQEGMVIHHNTMTENTRGQLQYGYNIKYYNEGYLRGLKIHDNHIVKQPAADISLNHSDDWNFAIELWHYQGGVEIYNNHIEGGIDTDHARKGGYAFSIDIHHNVFGYAHLQPQAAGRTNGGVYIEYGMEGPFYIRNNLFQNLGTPIQIYPRNESIADIHIVNNVFNGIGASNDGSGEALIAAYAEPGATMADFRFINNTVYVGDGGVVYGIALEHFGAVSSYRIQNNIFQGFAQYPVYSNLGQGSTLGHFFAEHNLFHGNGSNGITHLGNAPGQVSADAPRVAPPGFVTEGSDFHLVNGSPALGAGMPVDGVATDFDGVSRGNPPSIGAYEH